MIFPKCKIVGAPLGYYAVVYDYFGPRRSTVEEARHDLDRAIDFLDHSSTELIWLAI